MKLRHKPSRAAAEIVQSDAAAPGILLIETGGEDGNVIAAATVFMLIMTLAETGATSLLIETPVLGVSGGRSLGGPELVYRFDEEFGIIESNIKNLFDGIKLGSISPSDAAGYVNDVIKLTDQGKDRLLSAVIQDSEEQETLFENAAAVFGSVYIPGDLLVDVIRPEATAPPPETKLDFSMYSRPPPDKDGIIRRIPLILSAANGREYEYAAYSAIKKNYGGAEIRPADGLFTLSLKGGTVKAAGGGQDFILDRNAALLFGIPEGGADAFRKIKLALFLEYSETDRMLYRLLAESPELAQYADVSMENYPPFLYEQAALSREALLETPQTALLEQWKRLRSFYYDSLDRFFDIKDGADGKIISSFRNLGEQENLDAAGQERLNTLRNEQLNMYNTARDLYIELSSLRQELEKALNSSFCILGPASPDTELSAIFANSVMTGDYTVPANDKQIFVISFAVVLFLLLLACNMGTVLSLCFAVFATVVTVLCFSYSFVANGLWIDPFIPGAAVAAGLAASFLYALLADKRAETRLRRACGAAVPPAYLKKTMRSGGVNPEEGTGAKAAIVAVRCPEFFMTEKTPELKKFASELLQFRSEVCSVFLKAGAVIVSRDADIVSAAFGSPLERAAGKDAQKRAAEKSESVGMAVQAVNELFETSSSAGKLYAGIDFGECLFVSTPITGYTAAGGAIFRSRLLSTMACRRKIRVLISKAAGEYVDRSLLLEAPSASDTTESEPYYRLVLK
ncbi:MAG: hypothetical protein LBH50_02900 [Spirochaetaceae bacterium]|nr:hypothetical protein [Spirochaetaceae bacterium]